MSKNVETALGDLERKILRRIYRPTQENVWQWRLSYNHEIVVWVSQDINVLTQIELCRLEWTGHICRMNRSRTPRKTLEGKIYGSRTIGKPKVRRKDLVKRGVTDWGMGKMKMCGIKTDKSRARNWVAMQCAGGGSNRSSSSSSSNK
jgi:hypothetical protein